MVAAAVFVFLFLSLFSFSSGMRHSFNGMRNPSYAMYNPSRRVRNSSPFVRMEISKNVFRPASVSTESILLQSLERDLQRSRQIAHQMLLASIEFKNTVYARRIEAPKRAPINNTVLSVPVVSGMASGSGDYHAEVYVGTPGKKMHMIVDTGSDLTWIQCSPCRSCYKQQDRIFQPSNSSSYRAVHCNDSVCSKLDMRYCSPKRLCMYEAAYGDGSSSVGELSLEKVTLGKHSVGHIPMGCGHDNAGLFFGADGLFGMGNGPLSFPIQLRYSSFYYCLPKRQSKTQSKILFGGSLPGNTVVTPLLDNQAMNTFYYVNLTGISVAGTWVNISSEFSKISPDGTGGVILDTGTTITMLAGDAYYALRDAFRMIFPVKKYTDLHYLDTCYNLSKMVDVPVPRVVLEFEGGATMPLPPENILLQVDDKGMHCLAFNQEPHGFSIIGNTQQQTFGIYVDTAKKEMLFTPDRC